jgi:hypothetical protein
VRGCDDDVGAVVDRAEEKTCCAGCVVSARYQCMILWNCWGEKELHDERNARFVSNGC